MLKTAELEACASYTLSDNSESDYEFEKSVHDNVLDLAKNCNNIFENFLAVLVWYVYVSKYFRTVGPKVVVIHGFINV